MEKMIIFEPAMCCSTGVCGPSVDENLLRITTVVNNLQNKGILIERYNLSSNPQIFIDNKIINEILEKEGVDVLPVTLVNGEVVKRKSYPTNDEICTYLNITEDKLNSKKENSACCESNTNDCC